ncbi:MAG: 2-C-methyl-D-erythritol 4-phosphate cytidylyltransferase [Verrucomicrobiota bacterium]|jgi:2-C-methyl-D-erythritol 4-phosphate cytidylyltransferase
MIDPAHLRFCAFLSCQSRLNQRMSIAAIIVAAGSSQRMGFDKLAAPLGASSVLAHSVKAFCDCSLVDEVIVVCSEQRFASLLANQPFAHQLRRVDGGASRQESVQRGLDVVAVTTEIVAVHDGARPLIRQDVIEQCLSQARQHGACSLARRVTETLKRATPEDVSCGSVDRAHLWFMETPQCFALDLLQRAYAQVRAKGVEVTDEVSAIEHIGIGAYLWESRFPNVKITIPADLELAAYLLDAASCE